MGLLSNVSVKLLVVYIMFGISGVLITMLDVFIFVCDVIRGPIAIVVVCFIPLDSVLFFSVMVDITALDGVEETRESPKIRQQHSFNFVNIDHSTTVLLSSKKVVIICTGK